MVVACQVENAECLQLLGISVIAEGTWQAFPKMLTTIQGKQYTSNRAWIRLIALGMMLRFLTFKRSHMKLCAF